MGEEMLYKCPACAADAWRHMPTQWNEWQCLSCLAYTKLVDGIMDLCPPREDLPGIDDEKMLQILGPRQMVDDASYQ